MSNRPLNLEKKEGAYLAGFFVMMFCVSTFVFFQGGLMILVGLGYWITSIFSLFVYYNIKTNKNCLNFHFKK